MTARGDLSLGELSASQRSASLALSRPGSDALEKVEQIMEGDETLKTNERNNPMVRKDPFHISILGTASEKNPWTLQFGGAEHHHRGGTGVWSGIIRG